MAAQQTTCSQISTPDLSILAPVFTILTSVLQILALSRFLAAAGGTHLLVVGGTPPRVETARARWLETRAVYVASREARQTAGQVLDSE